LLTSFKYIEDKIIINFVKIIIKTQKEMWQRFLDSKILKIIKNKFLIVGVVFAVWITFFDGNSLIDWAKVILDINEQEEQKSYYKQEIETTEEKLLELGSNLDSLEKFAREQYFFQEEGEDIFIVQEKK